MVLPNDLSSFHGWAFYHLICFIGVDLLVMPLNLFCYNYFDVIFICKVIFYIYCVIELSYFLCLVCVFYLWRFEPGFHPTQPSCLAIIICFHFNLFVWIFEMLINWSQSILWWAKVSNQTIAWVSCVFINILDIA